MGKTIYLHGFWLLIAIGTFLVGRTVQVSSREGESARAARRDGGSGGVAGAGGPESRRAGERPEGEREMGALGGRALSAESMKIAIASVLADNDPVSRQRRFAELLASLTPENARAAVDAVREAPRSNWSWWQELNLLTYAWGRIDGESAAAYAMEQEGRNKEWTMASVLAGWANDDPVGAKEWVAGLENEDERSRAMRGLVQGLAQKDIEAATQFVYSLDPDTPRMNEYIDSIARQQLSLGMEQAAAWSSTLPDGPVKGSALQAVAREFVRSDPARAAEWVSAFGEAEYGERAIAEVSEEWAEQDHAAALDWVTTLPAGENRSRALGETISEWARENPVEAGEYVSALPAGGERDVAIGAYARRLVDREPVAALEWAQSIEQDGLRNETIARTARDWMRRDVVAASEWLEGAELPEQVAAQILQPGEDRGRWERR